MPKARVLKDPNFGLLYQDKVLGAMPFGIEQLWDARVVTINSVGVDPDIFFCAADINWTAMTWKDRVTGIILSLTGAGADPTQIVDPWGNPAVLFGGAGAKYFTSAETAVGDVTTEDMVVRIIIRMPSVTTNADLAGKFGATNGWKFITLNNYLYLWHSDGTAASPACLRDIDQWIYVGFHLMRSSRSRAMVYGVDGTTNSDVRAGSLTNTTALRIGYSGGGAVTAGAISMIAMWKRASWMVTDLNLDVEKNATERLTGIRAQRDSGGIYRPVSW